MGNIGLIAYHQIASQLWSFLSIYTLYLLHPLLYRHEACSIAGSDDIQKFATGSSGQLLITMWQFEN